MDACLGLGLGGTLFMMVQSIRYTSRSSCMDRPRESNLSWPSVSKSVPLQRLKLEMEESSFSGRTCSASSVSSVSDISFEDSRSTSSKSSSVSAFSKMSLWGQRKRDVRKPALLERMPLGRPSGYLTVHVGTRTNASAKYAIRKALLRHPLFQVLLKCSEDEFGEDYRVNKAVSIACDPCLFLEVVKAVDEEIWVFLSYNRLPPTPGSGGIHMEFWS
ncbi:hypothetical protein R1sor_004243 [Riccia sorocarpa]|uniref:Uncharacterized protein n=1 Tax=Riccia sorocarpa TaxID=122646 RepID=A0ABD3H623_9MARC